VDQRCGRRHHRYRHHRHDESESKSPHRTDASPRVFAARFRASDW
jgi:hypothetical protein